MAARDSRLYAGSSGVETGPRPWPSSAAPAATATIAVRAMTTILFTEPPAASAATTRSIYRAAIRVSRFFSDDVRREISRDRPSHPRHHLDQRHHVVDIGVKIHDAGAQRVAPVDDRIRHEHLAFTLQPVEDRPIERVERVFD